MARKGYIIADQFGAHFMTFTIVGWVDVFTRLSSKQMIIEAMQYCQNKKGLQVHGYVIMSSHLHVIWSAKEGSVGLSSIVRDFKKHTAKQIIKSLESNKESRREWMGMVFKYHAKFNKRNSIYQVWRQDNMPKELRHPRFIRRKLDYIHMNPVVAGIVQKEEDYLYSSARNYLEMDELKLEVELLEFGAEEGFVFT